MTAWARLLTEPVVILTAPRADDDYGPLAADWDHPSSYGTTARLQPAGSSETLANADVQQGDMLVYLPPGTPITGRDQLQAGGVTYQVIGPPERWRQPWSPAEHHVRALLRTIERASTPDAGERYAEGVAT